MAKEPAASEQAPAEDAQPKPKGKKMLVIIVAVVAFVVLAGGGVAVWLLTSKPHAEQKAGNGVDEEEAKEDEAAPPVYEKLDQFTVNLADGESYLQVEIHLLIADAKVAEKLKLRMPEVRDDIIRLLSSMTAEDLSVLEGKDTLADEIQAKVNKLLGVKRASQGVKKVLFNAFIIQ